MTEPCSLGREGRRHTVRSNGRGDKVSGCGHDRHWADVDLPEETALDDLESSPSLGSNEGRHIGIPAASKASYIVGRELSTLMKRHPFCVRENLSA